MLIFIVSKIIITGRTTAFSMLNKIFIHVFGTLIFFLCRSLRCLKFQLNSMNLKWNINLSFKRQEKQATLF